jgi:hypothetical protein
MSCPLWGATYPRRVAQAWYRHWTDERRQVYGAKARTAVPGLEDVSAQSCRWHCGDGPVCRSDRVVPAALWAADHGPWPATNPLARRHGSPTSSRQPVAGSKSSPSDPRSGCLLWPDICSTRSFARDSRSPNLSTLALSKWLCGAPDRLDPPRMPAPRAYRRPTRAWGTVPSIRADLICDSDRMEFSERTGP